MDLSKGLQGLGLGGGLGGLFGGLFSDPSKAYRKAQQAYQGPMNQAIQGYNPFYQAGVGAIDPYRQAIDKMQNPTEFLNSIMGQYQESPWSKYLKDEAERSGINAASAQGLMGSSPFLQQQQQNAVNLSSQDLQNYLANALGINTNYLQGLNNLFGTGFGAAQGMGNLYGQQASDLAQLAYAKEQAKQDRSSNIFGGLGGVLGGIGGALGFL